MIRFSDALPIQFWNYGLPTFNEKEDAGIDIKCYNHKINLEDTCTLQFSDTVDITKNYSLQVKDIDGVQVSLTPFTKEIIYSGAAVYYLESLYSDLDIVEGFVEFLIVETEDLSNIIGVSDYHDARVMHLGTRILKSSNKNDYENIIFTGVATVPVFQIRIHSKFFEWKYPEENESERLGDGTTIKLSGSTSKMKLLEVEPAPDYFHLKLKLNLQMNTIEIENYAWSKDEEYEKTKLNDRYGLFSGKVFLTPKDDSYITNV